MIREIGDELTDRRFRQQDHELLLDDHQRDLAQEVGRELEEGVARVDQRALDAVDVRTEGDERLDRVVESIRQAARKLVIDGLSVDDADLDVLQVALDLIELRDHALIAHRLSKGARVRERLL